MAIPTIVYNIRGSLEEIQEFTKQVTQDNHDVTINAEVLKTSVKTESNDGLNMLIDQLDDLDITYAAEKHSISDIIKLRASLERVIRDIEYTENKLSRTTHRITRRGLYR